MALEEGGNALNTFIFGGNDGLSYEELKRRRAIASALAARQRGFPKNVGEGLTYLGESIGEAVGDWRLREMEKRQQAGEQQIHQRAPGTGYIPPVETGPPPARPSVAPAPAPAPAPARPSVAPAPAPAPAPAAPPAYTPGPASDGGGVIAPPDQVAALSPPQEDPTTAPPPEPPPEPVAAAEPQFARRFNASYAPTSEPPTAQQPDMQALAFNNARMQNQGGPQAGIPPGNMAGGPTYNQDQIAALAAPLSPVKPPPELAQQQPPQGGPGGPPQPPMSMPTAAVNPPVDPRAPRPGPAGPGPGLAPPQQAAAPAPASRGFAYGGKALPPAWEAAIQRQPEQYRDYLRQMALKETGGKLNDVSSTGATGPLQFTRGTGQKYGLVGRNGDMRNDPDAAFSAGTRLTQANEAGLRAKLGRDPTFQDLAGAHQQGLGGYTALSEGRLPPARNLAVNKLPADPQAALSRLHAYYGFPPGVGPGGGGTQVASNPRDAVTTALMQQQNGPPSEREIASEALMNEVVGGGRSRGGGSATASLGRAGVMSDAPLPGIGGVGSATDDGIAAAVKARQGIYNAVQQQQLNVDPPVPEVPDPDPTQAGVTPPTMTSPASSNGGKFAQARGIGTVDDTGGLIIGGPRPAQDSSQGITPAPNMPPSREPIPPAGVEEMPEPGPAPVRPRALGPSQAQAYWAQYMNNPRVSEQMQHHAKRMYDAEEGYRKELMTRQENEYINDREKWEAATLAKQKDRIEAPVRAITQQVQRLAIEEAQHKASLRPAEAEKARVDLEKARADLEEAIFKQGVPRGQALEEANLRIAQARRNVSKPDSISTGGTTMERPYDASGTPTGPYAVPPGAPQPKEDLTETQAKAVQFVLRTKPDLDKLEHELQGGKALTSFKDAALDMTPGVGNKLVSDEYRRARDASLNWGAAFLSHVSGQAVSPTEAGRNLPAFLARPGDTDQDIADKTARRRAMSAAIEQTSGRAGLEILHKKVQQENDNYEYKKNGEREPVKISKAEEGRGLPPGTRLILPDGQPGRVPMRTR